MNFALVGNAWQPLMFGRAGCGTLRAIVASPSRGEHHKLWGCVYAHLAIVSLCIILFPVNSLFSPNVQNMCIFVILNCFRIQIVSKRLVLIYKICGLVYKSSALANDATPAIVKPNSYVWVFLNCISILLWNFSWLAALFNIFYLKVHKEREKSYVKL